MAINSITEALLLQGPADLYYKTAGFSAGSPTASEPGDWALNTAPATSAWTYLGPTDGGITVAVKQEYNKLTVDQLTDPLGARLSSRETTVKTSLAGATLQTLLWSLNGGTYTTGATVDAYTPDNASNAGSIPTYGALLFDGYAPGSSTYRRRFIMRKVLSTDGVSYKAQKDDKSMYEVTIESYYIDSSTASFRISQDPASE